MLLNRSIDFIPLYCHLLGPHNVIGYIINRITITVSYRWSIEAIPLFCSDIKCQNLVKHIPIKMHWTSVLGFRGNRGNFSTLRYIGRRDASFVILIATIGPWNSSQRMVQSFIKIDWKYDRIYKKAQKNRQDRLYHFPCYAKHSDETDNNNKTQIQNKIHWLSLSTKKMSAISSNI